MLRAVEYRSASEWPSEQAADSLTLDYDNRHRRRIRLKTDAGADLLLDLPKAVAMAHGDGLKLEDGCWLRVNAAPEALIEIGCDESTRLARIAWHIGNRHCPAQIVDAAIRIRPDHVMEAMVAGLGGAMTRLEAPFQPEGGAYAAQGHGGHRQSHHHGHGHGHHSHDENGHHQEHHHHATDAPHHHDHAPGNRNPHD
jgi:urease accessory protein